ncbi:MAG: fumarylacetoacetate hydrolase family protein [Chloroflexota bacterium]|nr:fumarylacetoacetate hydrolase family protein [Chloroflexota bacterium]MDE2946805.1 fumarylacetoacetate hydrolase family protein [Chloroflexota bacterium]
MKLLRYAINEQTYCGVLNGEEIMRLGLPDLRALMSPDAAFVETGQLDKLADARIMPPLLPGKILAIGRNYAEHARELNNEAPSEPLVFAIMPSALIGDGDIIEWEAEMTAQVDWEGELAVIIGKTARKVSAADALDAVFGYTIANDISARDLQSRDKQWTRAKGLDTFCPLGPVIVSADAIPDPQNLRIVTTVDGVEMQNGSTADMIFDVRFLIAHLSRAFTLNPGDVILTGTPAGVGKARKPPQFLGDGSVVSVEIAGIGKLTNRCRVL